MSILLEALRKSEKAQRGSKPPGIGDDLPAAPAAVRFRPVLLAAAIVVAVAASGWFIWRQYRPPAGYQPPVSLPARTRTPVEKPLAAAQSGRGAGSARRPATPARPAATVGAKPAGGQRTPVESFKTPVASASSGQKGPAPAPDDAAKVAAALAAAQQPAAAEPAAGSGPEKATGSEPFEPQAPEPISYWELPDAVRAQVPEIKFTVLVYARRPQDRFVLIDGQRLTEGDALPSGPKIVEIRLDGVVFSYRLYHFLVKR